MNIKYIILSIFLITSSFTLFGQHVSILHKGNKVSLRGLSVVSDDVIWVSGSSGSVAKSLDSGKTWQWFTVKGFEKTDFRDIEAFDKNTAIIMAIDSPAYILKTIDGGENWKVVFENHTSGMFLDAMDFYDNNNGVVIGDPINNLFFIARTKNSGSSWQIDSTNKLSTSSGEACFASSGTNIVMLNSKKYIVVSGGKSSNLFYKKRKINLPLLQGKESTGANSIAVKSKVNFIVVGGDFTQKDSVVFNCAITYNGGKTWHFSDAPPIGYRSCISFIKNNIWVTCGLNGVDISTNNGKTFKQVSNESFHVCKKSKSGKSVFFAGSNGKIGKYFN
jgi:photosystem II stability/assembly factor-like uncharacterized protein